MPWWSQTYLNEGFARYLQYVAAQYLYPEWNVWEYGRGSFFDFAYSFIKTDSLGLSPPEVTPDDYVSGSQASVKAAFAGPTYPKGAALNRMLNLYVGDDAWNAALAYQIANHKFTNPSVQDLMHSFDVTTNLNITAKVYHSLTHTHTLSLSRMCLKIPLHSQLMTLVVSVGTAAAVVSSFRGSRSKRSRL
jgi:aminopeptidase N